MPLADCSSVESLPQEFSVLWAKHYTTTNSLEKSSSLAPRLSKVGLVHGAVLHVFPALALSVKTAPLKRDRTLKVCRVEHSSEKILGVKFPLERVDELMSHLNQLKQARSGSEGKYKTLGVEAVEEKRIKRMGKKENTMMTFFGGKGDTKSQSVFGAKRPAGATEQNIQKVQKVQKVQKQKKGKEAGQKKLKFS
jgi:hypothetical protein